MSVRVDEKTGKMLRPNEYDEFVVRRAAELALPQVRGWSRERTDAVLMCDLVKAGMWVDGKHICERLRLLCGWDTNERLRRIFDQGDFMSKALGEMTRKWVACVGPAMDIPKGAYVTARKRAPEGVGEVIGAYGETCEYLLRFPGQPRSYRVVAELVSVATQDEIAEWLGPAATREAVEA